MLFEQLAHRRFLSSELKRSLSTSHVILFVVTSGYRSLVAGFLLLLNTTLKFNTAGHDSNTTLNNGAMLFNFLTSLLQAGTLSIPAQP